MKHLVRIFFLALTVNLLSSAGFSQPVLSLEVQNPNNSVWESHNKVGLCPGISRSYQIINYRSDCHKVTIEGTFGAVPVLSSDGKFTTGWADAVATSKVRIDNVGTPAACGNGNAASDKTFDIPVLNIAGTTPTMLVLFSLTY